MFTLAHLSDVHLAPLPRPRLADVSLKRATGYVNWHRNRKRLHRADVLERMTADLALQGVDHVAVTGDLVNIGLPEEFVRAARWLTRLGDPDRVTVVPGNHDCYVRLRRDPGSRRWLDYMRSDAQGAGLLPLGSSVPFPFVRRFGRVALIGLGSGVPTPPLVAAGRLGPVQIEALAHVLRTLGALRLCRIVLIHHPPLPGQAKRLHGLADADKLQAVLASEGAELVLHGHLHRQMLAQLAGPERPIPVVGVPSASAGWPGHAEPARYNMFQIAAAGTGWRIHMTGRQWAGDDAPIETVETVQLGE